MRYAEVNRKTNETDIQIKLTLEGSGRYDVKSGSGFFDHMLEQFARHGGFDIYLRCKGDTEVDFHHSAEDCGIALGTAFLQALLRTGFVPREKTAIPLRRPADEALWSYVCTQADADSLMRQFAGFHDATLDRLFYKERYGVRQLTVRFDNPGWYGTLDLCFEGTLALHLAPAGENRSRALLEACLPGRDATVFGADAALTEEDPAACRNHIKALNLKWRKAERT